MASHHIRIGAYAAITQADQVLVVELEKNGRIFFHLPGGGVGPDESLSETLHREVQEETGFVVRIKHLLMVWEYVPKGPTPKYADRHELELIFQCEPVGESQVVRPQHPDAHQVRCQWVPIEKMPQIGLVPDIGDTLLSALKTSHVYNPFRFETG